MKPIEVIGDTVRTRPKLIRRMRLVMFLGLVGSPIVFGVGLFQYLETKSLQAAGITVDAAVHDSSVSNTGKGRRVHRIVADYQPEGYPIHRKEFVVLPGEYDAARASGSIQVTFLPTKPSVSVAGTEIRPDSETMAIGGGVFVVAALLWLYFKKKERDVAQAIFSNEGGG